jgi:excisionase family DNA binding protein
MKDSDPQGPPTFEDWITPREAAALLGVTSHHVRYLTRKGIIEGRKFGHAWMVSRTSVEDYAATERRPGPRSRTPSESD